MLSPRTILASFTAFSLLYLASASLNPTIAYYNNMPASVIVGQANATENTITVSPSNFAGQIRGLIVDSAGRLIVSDRYNHRVLIWNSVPTTNGKAADIVLGQPDFTSNTLNNGGRSAQSLSHPTGVYSDGQKLFVYDAGNSRILIWNTFPTVNQQAANLVVGQSDMTS